MGEGKAHRLVLGCAERERTQKGKITMMEGPHKQKKTNGLMHWQLIAFYLGAYDVIAINFSYFFGLLIRFDLSFSKIPKAYLVPFLRFAPIYTIFAIIIFKAVGLYRSVWRFASFTELNRIFIATLITTGFQIVGITLFLQRMPISY